MRKAVDEGPQFELAVPLVILIKLYGGVAESAAPEGVIDSSRRTLRLWYGKVSFLVI